MEELIEQYGEILVQAAGGIGILLLFGACCAPYQEIILRFFSGIFFR